MAGAIGEFHFIDSHPRPGATSAETQRRIHSLAARATHAKARRQRVSHYQYIKGSSGRKDEMQPCLSVETEMKAASIPSPSHLLMSYRRDHFASFARRLYPIEDFLLDYCESEISLF